MEMLDRLLASYAPLAPVEGVPRLCAHQATDVYAIWVAWEEMIGAVKPPPYWAIVWPAAAAAAAHIMAHPEIVHDRRALDWGCGGGVVAIAASVAGARQSIANDIDPLALRCAEKNAAANAANLHITNENLIDKNVLPSVDVIFVADMFYESAAARRMHQLLKSAAFHGVSVYIADGGRPFAPRRGIIEIDRRSVPVDEAVEGVAQRMVRLYTLDTKACEQW